MNDGMLNKEEKKAEKAKKREENLAKKMEEKQVKRPCPHSFFTS
jgi:hypothetical protein